LRSRGGVQSPALLSSAARIVTDVAVRGDKALFKYTEKFDGCKLSAGTVRSNSKGKKENSGTGQTGRYESHQTGGAAHRRLSPPPDCPGYKLKKESGIELGQRILPLRRVGVYAPGGKASYPSTILMAAIPARIAGVKETILVSPARDGKINPLIAAAAEMSGVKRIFKIGGAQAIAALAYGTETIPQVDKIVGPGNAYVAAAKNWFLVR